MNGQDEPRPVWIVTGPLDLDKLPAGCRAEKLPPELVRQLSELLRGLERLAQYFDT